MDPTTIMIRRDARQSYRLAQEYLRAARDRFAYAARAREEHNSPVATVWLLMALDACLDADRCRASARGLRSLLR
jgi:hypothetical protein